MNTLCRSIIQLIMCACLGGSLHAEPINIDAATHQTSMAGYLYASPAGAVIGSAQEALALYRSGGFQKMPGHLARGYNAATAWVAFDLHASPGAPSMVVAEVGPAALDRVTAYQADAQGQLVVLGQAGDQVPKAQVSLMAFKPSFAVRLVPGAGTTVLFQIKTTSTQAAIVKIYRAADFPAAQTTLGLVLGAIFTTALILAITALGFYAVFRDTGYLAWLAYLVVTTAHWFMVDGLAYFYLDWAELRHINLLTNLLVSISLSVGTFFFSLFFQFHLLGRWLHRSFMVASAVMLVAGSAGVLLGYPLAVSLVSLMSFPVMAAIVVSMLIQMYRGHRLSRWLGPILLFYVGCAIVNMLAAMGLVAYSDLVFYGWQAAGFFNLLAMQVAMYVQARAAQRRLSQERSQLTAQLTLQNQALEDQVSNRTEKLANALRSVQQAESEQRQLMSMASHEFRTPAAMIKASLDSLAFIEDRITPEVQTRLDNIRIASQRLNTLSNSLITQDRLIELTLKPDLLRLDLSQLVSDVLARYTRADQVRGQLPATAATVVGDAALLSIALHNLIDNALRHGQPVQDPNQPVTVTLTVEGDQLILKVADYGAGIPDAEKSKVFERFHVVAKKDRRVSDRDPKQESRETSNGLGLAIVKNIAEAHGGQVWVQDNTPHGAILVLQLPNADSEQKETVAPVPPA